jgi:hypothetical protein
MTKPETGLRDGIRQDGTPAGWSSGMDRSLAAAVGLCAVLFLVYALLSKGTYTDDDITHFLFARFAWKHPELFLDFWGRPVFTVIHAPAALLGFSAARIVSVCLAAGTCLVAGLLARSYGVRRAWMAAVLTAVQPEFLRQSFSTLTELPFALLFVLALYCLQRQQWGKAALLAGLFPLARIETFPMVMLVGAVLVFRRQFRWIPLLAFPVLVQNGLNALIAGDASVLLFPLNRLAGTGPGGGNIYPSGSYLYYWIRTASAYGHVLLVFAAIGFFTMRQFVLQASVITAVATLSLCYSLLPSSGIGGGIRHLAVVAPAVGILAAGGIEYLCTSTATWKQRILPSLVSLVFGIGFLIRRSVLGMIGSLAVLGTLGFSLWVSKTRRILETGCVLGAAAAGILAVKPFSQTLEDRLAMEAARWVDTSSFRGRPVLVSHVWFVYASRLDPFDPVRCPPMNPEAVRTTAPGNLVVWDSHYSRRLRHQVPYEMLQDNPEFRLLMKWEEGEIVIAVFEKLETRP